MYNGDVSEGLIEVSNTFRFRYEMKANKKCVQESVRLDTCKKGRDKAKGWTIFERRANEDENLDTF